MQKNCKTLVSEADSPKTFTALVGRTKCHTGYIHINIYIYIYIMYIYTPNTTFYHVTRTTAF